MLLFRFYAADVMKVSFEVFDRCKHKVLVTANLMVMVEAFVKDYLDSYKVFVIDYKVYQDPEAIEMDRRALNWT